MPGECTSLGRKAYAWLICPIHPKKTRGRTHQLIPWFVRSSHGNWSLFGHRMNGFRQITWGQSPRKCVEKAVTPSRTISLQESSKWRWILATFLASFKYLVKPGKFVHWYFGFWTQPVGNGKQHIVVTVEEQLARSGGHEGLAIHRGNCLVKAPLRKPIHRLWSSQTGLKKKDVILLSYLNSMLL